MLISDQHEIHDRKLSFLKKKCELSLKLKAVSLFWRASGLDLGIQQASSGLLEFCSWVESDQVFCEPLALNHNIADDHFFDDVNSVNQHAIIDLDNRKKGGLFLVVGDPTCHQSDGWKFKVNLHGIMGCKTRCSRNLAFNLIKLPKMWNELIRRPRQ